LFTHQIIHTGTGVKPRELRFTSEEEAKQWLAYYQVTPEYKAENYRIEPIAANGE
jgi:hypothetical protein